MKTDDLIRTLSRDAAPVAPRSAGKRLALAAAFSLAASAAVAAFGLGVRPDIAAASAPTLFKALLVAILLGAAVPLTWRASRPALRLQNAAAPLVAFFGASALAALLATLLAPEGGRLAALVPVGFPPCLTEIPITAAPAGVIMFLALRALGPTRLAHAGAAAGATAGAVGALAYSLHCTVDSPAYVLAWYPAAVALCAGAGALLGPRLLRW